VTARKWPALFEVSARYDKPPSPARDRAGQHHIAEWPDDSSTGSGAGERRSLQPATGQPQGLRACLCRIS
jgi:hypothetical protein